MKRSIVLGIFLTVLFFFIHVSILDDYGLTWDFHHHFFAGLHHLGIPLSQKLTNHIPFTVPDPRTTSDLPFGPLMLITPVTTYLLLNEKLHLLPMDQAYNIGIVIVAMLGLLVLYLFLLESEGLSTALIGFFFLALLPRYFGDLHNNMKDVPQSAVFALAIWMYWRLLNWRRPKDLVFAVTAFAIAFNMKINTLFVPAIALSWTIVVLLTNTKKYLRRPMLHIKKKDLIILCSYFLLAPLTAFALWMPFWNDPIERLLYLFRFFQDNTRNLEVLFFGTIYRSTINVPWYYPYGYLAITTPLPILVFFFIGLMRLLRQIKKNQLGLLLILWFFIPLARYLNPKIGVIDGIRHFEEVIYPLSAIAAIGAVSLVRFFNNITMKQFNNRRKRFITVGATGLAVAYLLWINISYHPYQISYFNELVGGIRGALGKFDIDYWGTSQKNAILWLNAHAPKGSVVHIVMAPEAAATYLRPDLLRLVNTRGFDAADFVVVLNRQSFFYRYYRDTDHFYGLTNYMNKKKPVYEVTRMGVPLTMVFNNALPSSPFPNPWWLDPKFMK